MFYNNKYTLSKPNQKRVIVSPNGFIQTICDDILVLIDLAYAANVLIPINSAYFNLSSFRHEYSDGCFNFLDTRLARRPNITLEYATSGEILHGTLKVHNMQVFNNGIVTPSNEDNLSPRQ